MSYIEKPDKQRLNHPRKTLKKGSRMKKDEMEIVKTLKTDRDYYNDLRAVMEANKKYDYDKLNSLKTDVSVFNDYDYLKPLKTDVSVFDDNKFEHTLRGRGINKQNKNRCKFCGGNISTEPVEDKQSYTNALFNGRNNYAPKDRAILSKIGNEIITGFTIGRTALISAIKTAGEYIIGDKIPYDNYYHLFLIISLNNGQLLRLEKNHITELSLISSFPNADLQMIYYIPSGLTVNELLNNTQNYMGGKYFLYQAFGNNCQDFVLSVLRANNININKQDTDFIKQDVKGSLKNNTFLRKASNSATDLARVADVAYHGAGIKSRNKKIKNGLKNWV